MGARTTCRQPTDGRAVTIFRLELGKASLVADIKHLPPLHNEAVRDSKWESKLAQSLHALEVELVVEAIRVVSGCPRLARMTNMITIGREHKLT